MSLNEIKILANIATSITAILIFFQLFIAVISLIMHHKREKMKATVDYYEKIEPNLQSLQRELKYKYGDALSTEQCIEIDKQAEDRAKLTRFLNLYNRLSIGIRKNIYDFDIINDICGNLMVNHIDRYRNYIKFRRKIGDDDKLWFDFEFIANRIRSIRSYQKKI